MADSPHDTSNTYFHIEGDYAEVIDVTESFWPDVMAGKRKLGGWLVAGCHFEGNPDHAERHPNGDEILVLISGRLDVVLDEEGGRRTVALRPGEACFVPHGVWHWQLVHEPSRLLALTCGKGTEHRSVPE